MMSSFDADYLLEQYEVLRRQALEALEVERFGLGLSLFLTRGMPSWLEALTALAPAPTRLCPSTERPTSERLPDPLPFVRSDVTVLLAGAASHFKGWCFTPASAWRLIRSPDR